MSVKTFTRDMLSSYRAFLVLLSQMCPATIVSDG